jgi:probable rRNA maturation factor
MGFDHETGQTDCLKMEEKSLELLRELELNKDLNIF